MPAPLIGEPLAGRASPAVRTGPIGRKAAGPVLIGSSICIAAVNLDSGAQPFPIAKASLVQQSRYRLASGRPPSVAIRDISLRPEGVFPTRGAGAKRLRGCTTSHVSVPYPGCWKAILRTTSPSLLRNATSPCRRGFGSPCKVSGFARGSPTRRAVERKRD